MSSSRLSPAVFKHAEAPPAPKERVYATPNFPPGQTLSGLLQILRRRWKTASAAAIGTFSIGVLIGSLLTPQYDSTSILEINSGDGGSTAERDTPSIIDPEELKTEIETDIAVLQSDGIALNIIQALHLVTVAPFRGAVYEDEKGKPLEEAPRSREAVLKVFEKHLTVESPPDTRLITVTFRNPNAALAEKVANGVAQGFIDNTAERHHNSTFRASLWLRQQLDVLKQQVQESEQKLADYERDTGLAGIQLSGAATGDGSSTVSISPRSTITDRLFSLNQELGGAESNRISTEIMARLLKTQDPEVVLGLGSMGVGTTTSSGSGVVRGDEGMLLLQALRSQEIALSQDYAAAKVNYGENNPRLVQIQQRMDAIHNQMHAEVQRISDRAENNYLYAKASEDAIRQQFTQQEAAANVLADKTVKLQLLAQEAYSNQALYESLFSKLQTATLASGVRSTRIDVLDVARTGGHAAFPPWNKGLPVLFVISMFLGISSAFLLESLDQTLRSSQDLDEIADVPVLPYIPSRQIKGHKNGLRLGKDNFLEAPQSAFSEAFRSLRTSVILTTASIDKKMFLVTSPSPADGKTTVTYNLGIAFAQQGARVLLIDGDLSRPKLHLLFGRRSSPGLVDIGDLAQGKEIEGIIQHRDVPTLFMLPAGRRLESQSEFFASRNFEMVLDECGRNYDYVFIDSPPILSMADASIIATKVSGIIAVVRSSSTTRPIFMSLLDALDRTGAPIVGITLNDVRKPHLNGFYEYSHKGYQLHGEM